MIDRPSPHLDRYRTGYWRDRTLADFAYGLAEADPDIPVLYAGDTVLTRAGAVADAEALAVSLRSLGLRQGDVISFLTPNWPEAMVINLAASILGLVVNPIVHIYRDAEVGMMLADSGSRALFVASTFRNYDYGAMAARLAPKLPQLEHVFLVRGEGGDGTFAGLVEAGRNVPLARPNVDPNAVKLLMYTSGTTGRPKAVLHSHNTLTRVGDISSAHYGVKPGDAMITPSPVTHISGYSNGLEMPFRTQTRTVLMESWDAREAVRLIKAYRVTGTVAATPFLTELAKAAAEAGTRLPSLRYFSCGGAAVPPQVIRDANAAFENCRAFRVFGSSEVPLVTVGYPQPDKTELAATTDGEVLDYDVRIEDEAGNIVPDGTEGEILARGPAMFLGYLDPEQTAEAITPDGFFRTGDIGLLTAEGSIVITGRKKDLIIRGGENISAKEIEDALHGHASVREAAVVAMPHTRLGEGVCAFVIVADGHDGDATALAEHVGSTGLARQKIPERFVFVPDFPRTASGKIRKDELRAMARRDQAEMVGGG